MKRTRKARDNGEETIVFRIQNSKEDYLLMIKRRELDDYAFILKSDMNIVTPITLNDYN